MSRLPSPSGRCDSAEQIHSIVLTKQLPILASQIAAASGTDKEIALVLTCVQHGAWPSESNKSLSPFYTCHHELSVVDGCLVWGRRVVIPQVFRQQLLKELHFNHIRMSRMKALARSYLWWPQLDRDIEQMARNCEQCKLTAPNPATAPAHPWLVPQNAWDRIHVDHAQWKNWLLFVTVDALSKWPEVFIVNSTSASQTIDKLRTMFSTHGLPVTLVSDNEPPFSSADFQDFMHCNGIVHQRVPPYHPSSKGLAENMVKSLKQALNKAHRSDSMETKIAKFLATYRATLHSVTGKSPAEILLQRLPRTRLSLIHPCMPRRMSVTVEQRVGHRPPRLFNEGQEVLLRDLRPNAPQKWRHAVILCKQGPLTYKVVVDGQTKQAHVDQLQPWQEHNDSTQLKEWQTPHETASTLADEDRNNTHNPFLIVDSDESGPALHQDASLLAEPVQRPHRDCGRPK